MNELFKGIFDAESAAVISVSDFVVCVVSSLVIGLVLALMYMYKNKYSKSFISTIALLPAVVCVVIMMVNGNVGAGVAVAGAFSLVRFRSAPGTAKEIGVLFLAMGAGLVTGMGYIGYAFLFVIIVGLANMIYTSIDFGGDKKEGLTKVLRVTIPEDLDYTEIFDDLFEVYTEESKLANVKTTNMGSLFKLTYNVVLKDGKMEKSLIDDMRCRNGNLEITVSNQETGVGLEL